MQSAEQNRFEAWLDEGNRIISFHEIPSSQYYSAAECDFWEQILQLVLGGYRIAQKIFKFN